MISIYDNDNDNHTSINTLVKTFSEKFACIINDVAKSDEVKNFMQSFITFLEDIASGKIQPDKDFIQGMIEIYRNNPADVPESIRGYVKELAENDTRPVIKATTHKAQSALIEVTNVGRKLRDKKALPALYEYNDREVLTGHTGKKNAKEVTAVVSLSFQELKEWEFYTPAIKRLKPFDIEILTHAVTLLDAGNNVISTDMLFRQMNGGKHKETTPAIRREIYDSFSRLAQTWVVINAREEYEAGQNQKNEFRGALLPCSMIIGDVILNGKPAHDCIKIYDISPLFEYAKYKRQVSNIPLGMFDIPNVNRTEENIVLIGYMIRAFADRENEKSKVNPVIAYDKIYEYLGVEGDNAKILAILKARIRATVRDILTAWVKGGFIRGFQELTADNKPPKKGVKVAKVRIDLFSAKELETKRDNENILPDK